MEKGQVMKSAGEHSTKAPPTLITHYGSDELKRIGDACSSRLPPASAVQAMFQYELQRATEVERLFQGCLFQLARSEGNTAPRSRIGETEMVSGHHYEARIRDIENELKILRKQATSKDVEERIATSKVRMTAQQTKLDELAATLEKRDATLDALTTKVTALGEKVSAKESEQQQPPPPQPAEEVHEALENVRADLDELFDERDALVDMVNEMTERINKLEDLVRVLTLQQSPTSSLSVSPSAVQRLPVQTPSGQMLDLAVPKGNGWTNGKENKPPIRTFTPGKQWQ